MRKAYQTPSQGLGMNDIITMSKELQDLRGIKLHYEDGFFAFIIPRQILGKPGEPYKGLPELIMAEDFVNIPVTLEKEYKNYKFPEAIYRGVFNYDLNKHLIVNLLDFRELLSNEEWFNNQADEVKARLLDSKFFIEEDGKKMLAQKSMLVNSDMTAGLILEHIHSYRTDIVMYTDPQITYRLSEEDRFNTTSLMRRIETEEDAEMFGVPIGYSVQTPWKEFSKRYNAAFNKIYIDPIREKYPKLDWQDIKKLPEYESAERKRLVGFPTYKVVTIAIRIEANQREEIEVTDGNEIPIFLNRLELKPNQLENYFKVSPDSDVNFDPSFAIYKVYIPKREGDGFRAIGAQYKRMTFSKPEVTLRHGREDSRVPTIHPVDKTFSKRLKEKLLDFPFKESYVTAGSKGFGSNLKLGAINEIIRNIALPLCKQLENTPEAEGTLRGMKGFLINDLGMKEEEFHQQIQEGLEGAQFSGMPPQPPQQTQYQPQQQYQQPPQPPQQTQYQPQQQYQQPPQQTQYQSAPPYPPHNQAPSVNTAPPIPPTPQQ